jgi:hypothetical protein
MPDTPVLPELTRSLRSFGAQRDAAGEAAHAAIFRPLLDARARAADAPLDTVLAAFRGDALSARIEAQAVDAAVQGVDQPAHVRALTAQTSELIEPLRTALLALDGASVAARADSAGWDGWVAQLKRVFTIADVACQALARLLANQNEKPSTPRWFERTPK